MMRECIILIGCWPPVADTQVARSCAKDTPSYGGIVLTCQSGDNADQSAREIGSTSRMSFRVALVLCASFAVFKANQHEEE